jgi:hypothetical protein
LAHHISNVRAALRKYYCSAKRINLSDILKLKLADATLSELRREVVAENEEEQEEEKCRDGSYFGDAEGGHGTASDEQESSIKAPVRRNRLKKARNYADEEDYYASHS